MSAPHSSFPAVIAAAAFAVIASIAHAQQPVGKAESWGVQNEELTAFSGRVVDIVCELTKSCPADCGAGARQLGVVSTAGKLILVSKNAQPAFNGAVPDLLPYCRKDVDVEGLFTGDDKTKVFQLQWIRERGASEWSQAVLWTGDWRKKNPTAPGPDEEWFYQDPRIKKQIDATGYLGLGHEADVEYVKKEFK